MVERIVHLLLLFVVPFYFIGVINRVKALWAGRRGPSLHQPFYDFLRLLRKGRVVSTTTSWVFQVATPLALAALLTAALLLPTGGGRSMLAFPGDFVFFAYLLGLARFLTVLAALDTGSSFEGMGASRELTFSTLAEPTFFVLAASLCFFTRAVSFTQMRLLLRGNPELTPLVLLLSVIVLFVLILAEGCRVPVDDPNTHLELTMIHEVMILDHSGPDLALMQYGAALKMTVLAALTAFLVIPPGLAWPAASAMWLGVILLSAVAVGLGESLLARLRLIHVPQFLLLAAAMALLSLVVMLLFTYGRAA